MKTNQMIAFMLLTTLFTEIHCKSKLTEYQNANYEMIKEDVKHKSLPSEEIPKALQSGEPVITVEDIKRDFFTNCVTITLVTEQINQNSKHHHDKITQTTRVFKTKNPTIFTWNNAALAAGALALIGLGAAYVTGVTNIYDVPDYVQYGMNTEDQILFNAQKNMVEKIQGEPLSDQTINDIKEMHAFEKKMKTITPPAPKPNNNQSFWDRMRAQGEWAQEVKERRHKPLQNFVAQHPNNELAQKMLEDYPPTQEDSSHNDYTIDTFDLAQLLDEQLNASLDELLAEEQQTNTNDYSEQEAS